MKYTGRCPKCENNEIKYVSGTNQSKIGIPLGITSWVAVDRYICLQCGYIEQYVDTSQSLQRLANKS